MTRIASNYLRLAVTFAVGLIVIRLMAEIGQSALMLYLLLIAGTGFAQLLKIVMQESVIPAMGLTFDGRSDRSFGEVYWAAIVTSLSAGVFGFVFFGLIWLCRGYFDFGALGDMAVTVAIGACAARTFTSSAATPFLHALLIDHRVVSYNVVLVLERLTELVAAIVAILLPPEYDLSQRVVIFYALSTCLYVALQAGVWIFAGRCDPRFRARRAPLRRADMRWIGGFLGWNVALVIGFALYARLSTLAVNAGLGEGATLTLGLVLALIGYQRQVAMGLVIGLDAAISRHYGRGEAKDARTLVLRSTYVQAVFAAFSVAALWIFIEPILRLWLGRSLDGSAWDIGQTILLFKIMSVGIVARSVSEAWMKFLSGKGEIRAYAPAVLGGGIVFAAVTIFAVTGFEAEQALIIIAATYAVMTALIHVGVIAIATARRLELTTARLLGLVAIPIAVAVAAGLLHTLLLGGDMDMQKAWSAIAILGLCGIGVLLPMRRVIALTVPDWTRAPTP